MIDYLPPGYRVIPRLDRGVSVLDIEYEYVQGISFRFAVTDNPAAVLPIIQAYEVRLADRDHTIQEALDLFNATVDRYIYHRPSCTDE